MQNGTSVLNHLVIFMSYPPSGIESCLLGIGRSGEEPSSLISFIQYYSLHCSSHSLEKVFNNIGKKFFQFLVKYEN